MVTRHQQERTPREEALLHLKEAGISIPEWSKANGFTAATVKAVLYGHSKASRGEAHRAAVALGIKAGVIVSPKGFQPVRRTAVKLKLAKR